MIDTEKLRQFTLMEKRKDEIEAELKRIREDSKILKGELMLQFENAGMQNANVDGLCIYVNRQLWARPKDGNMELLCTRLKAAGMGAMVKEAVNTNSLSAFVRELDREEKKLPAELEDCVAVEEVFDLRTRAS